MILFKLLFILQAQAVTPIGVCGNIDVVNTSNEQLARLVYNLKLGAGIPIREVQCGLGKETFAICQTCENQVSPNAMTHLRYVLASTGHLNWHMRWHTIRATKSFSASEWGQLQKDQWVPTNMSPETFLGRHGIPSGETAGEDFFFMHRLMIKMAQMELAVKNFACIEPWMDLPKMVNDPLWPVPKNFVSDPSSPLFKQAQAELEQMQKLLAKIRNPAWLKTVSLNRLGQMLEPGLHQNLHNFYRSTPVCSPESVAQGLCDDLLPFDKSPLNKYFWKLHGLVDQILVAWLHANGLDEIAVQCGQRPKCYQWKGTWVGRQGG